MIEVPSPTFTLMQAYELPRFTLVHADFYRLSGPAELAELGFDDRARGGDAARMAGPRRRFLPPDRLDIAFTLSPQHGPDVPPCARHRLRRLRRAGRAHRRDPRLPDARRLRQARAARMQGDASTRAYERLSAARARATS